MGPAGGDCSREEGNAARYFWRNNKCHTMRYIPWRIFGSKFLKLFHKDNHYFSTKASGPAGGDCSREEGDALRVTYHDAYLWWHNTEITVQR